MIRFWTELKRKINLYQMFYSFYSAALKTYKTNVNFKRLPLISYIKHVQNTMQIEIQWIFFHNVQECSMPNISFFKIYKWNWMRFIRHIHDESIVWDARLQYLYRTLSPFQYNNWATIDTLKYIQWWYLYCVYCFGCATFII